MPDLIDPFGRHIEYLRVSVTDKCNLRCDYCLPEGFRDFDATANYLRPEEIHRVVGAFARLGVTKVRLTGGEPLVRKDILSIASGISTLPGIQDLSLSTNASLLARYATGLKQAGVSRINVSLDSLNAARFQQITGGDLVPVIDGLMAAKAAGLHPIKINVVLMAGRNDDEIEAMVNFCLEHDFTLRFIETMPIGDTGRNASQYYLSLQTIRETLAKRYDLIPTVMAGGGPARYFQVKGSKLRIGFITPISQHFCETCNRVRLAADGTLYLCLGQEHCIALRPLLRDGINDQALEAVLLHALTLKPERHEFRENPGQIVRFMAKLGG